ncbi:MAG: exopolyphosphatase [Cellvibrionaceae bacterium]|nr:exopolyphosphatase [Cellvibrionaceae bacterium]
MSKKTSHPTRRIAAIDLGSNSFHMTLAEIGPHGTKTYHREKRKVRLAAGLDQQLLLDHAAIERALETIGVFGQILKEFNPDHVRAVGTYTFRAATNIEQLIQPANQLLTHPIEVLSGAEEARLIYQGVTLDQHRENHCLVVDIGGGSTEIVIGEALQAKLLHSCAMGCVSLTERFFGDGVITEQAFERAIVHADQQLETIRLRYMNLGWQHVIGSSGTIKALSNCAQAAGLSDGTLTSDVLNQFKNLLLKAGHRDAIQWPGLAEDRIPTLCGGLAVLIAVFDLLHIDTMTYSDAALREGLLHETQERLLSHDNRHASIALLAKRFGCDQEHANKVRQTALTLYDSMLKYWPASDDRYRNLLDWACQLHEIGHHINHLSCHKHAAYIVQQSDMAGFNREQQQVLAFLLLNQRKSLKMHHQPELQTFSLDKLLKVILLLRLAIRLNQFRQNQQLQSFTVSASKSDNLHLNFQPLWQSRRALFSADLDAEQAEFSPYGILLSYHFDR